MLDDTRFASDLAIARAAYEIRPDNEGNYMRLLETENRYLRSENRHLKQENKTLRRLEKSRFKIQGIR